jgi:hypothetical protein
MDLSRLDQFDSYVDAEVLPATADLENLAIAHRKHVQKLVYTNLVDRFDSTVDHTILDNCRADLLAAEATKGLTQAVTEADLIRLLLQAGDLQSALDEKLRTALRNTILRERHSMKLSRLFNAFSGTEFTSNKPRVNINTGAILNKMTPQSGKVPYSICGYADWLYARRNAVVHGSGSNKFLANDLVQIKRHYQCTPAPTIKIKLNSISVAATFYKGVNAKLRECAGA